jgi:MoaA/NifB/PqqE/SkfB family radical SAM enzyme
MKKGPSEINIITTYRCNAKCKMCNIWKYPTKKSEEFHPKDLESLPKVKGINITGGEPFLRDDIEDIINVLRPKSKRIVFSTNGYFTDRMLNLAKKYPELGYRISLEGLPKANDELRGIKNGFDRGLRTLLELKHRGIKDIGFAITISDKNFKDLVDLYELAKYLKMEFATAVLHNSHYFHKFDNQIKKKKQVISQFQILVKELLNSRNPKDWYRAYFNYGLMRKVLDMERLLPCTAGTDTFFIDPYGDVLPCNGMDEKVSMGNLKDKSFTEIWGSERAKKIREIVRKCNKQCWMIGSVGVLMRKNKSIPTKWIIKHKFLGKEISIPSKSDDY